MTHYLPHFPTQTIRVLFVDTELQLRSLRDTISNWANEPSRARSDKAHGKTASRRINQHPVPPAIIAEAHRVLAAVARIMAREQHWRAPLLLGEAPGWPELLVRLDLAATALRRFSTIYLEPDDPFDEDEEDADDSLPPLVPHLRYDTRMR